MEITLGENKYSLDIVGLKKWLELEELHKKIREAVEEKATDNIVLYICNYISTALDISEDKLLQLPWYEVATAFSMIVTICVPKYKLAILEAKEESEGNVKISWEYTERTFYMWANLLASAYSWQLDYIANLSFNDCLAMIQEIMVDRQLKKEWEWSLSELAYSYNEHTKRSDFHPLPRPKWMQETVTLPAPKKVKIHRSMLPIGNIIRFGDTNELLTN